MQTLFWFLSIYSIFLDYTYIKAYRTIYNVIAQVKQTSAAAPVPFPFRIK